MQEATPPAKATPRASARDYLWFALPLIALVAASVWLIAGDWLRAFDVGAPPVEKLTFERTMLDSDGIHLSVRAGGSEPVTIAQVTVDDAFWAFTQEPPGPIDRLGTAWLHIPYPWVLGEAHEIKVRTKSGVAFAKTIEVAVPTPKPQVGQLQPQALLGLFVGVIPVAIGMLFFPVLRSFGSRHLNFVLALTIGLLAFLFIDTLKEGLEIAAKAAEAFQGTAMVLAAAAAAFLVLMVVGRRHGTPSGLALATYIALGIGLHNFGEGLAIGAAFAAGVAGLGTFLVLGFTFHNVTEGIGIVAPLVEKRPALPVFIGLAALAGVPAIPGIWLGSVSFEPQWAALALAIGTGAILQVIVEVGAYLLRHAQRYGETWLSPATLAGFVIGLAVMYFTGFFVKI
ncbi:MAG: metal transporter [Bradyrhizobiaceae bacterium]|nr:metal transporter [Bradyrhizobiaceae bacterium]